jgi:hypothetical protein
MEYPAQVVFLAAIFSQPIHSPSRQ